MGVERRLPCAVSDAICASRRIELLGIPGEMSSRGRFAKPSDFPSDTIVTCTEDYTYDAKVWDLSIFCRPCQTHVTIRNFFTAVRPEARELGAYAVREGGRELWCVAHCIMHRAS
jgi:hypothetical protein